MAHAINRYPSPCPLPPLLTPCVSRDDIGDLKRTTEAMSLLGLSQLQVSQLLCLLSGILQLGNIEISATDGEEAALQVTNQIPASLSSAVTVLFIAHLPPPDQLRQSMGCIPRGSLAGDAAETHRHLA